MSIGRISSFLSFVRPLNRPLLVPRGFAPEMCLAFQANSPLVNKDIVRLLQSKLLQKTSVSGNTDKSDNVSKGHIATSGRFQRLRRQKFAKLTPNLSSKTTRTARSGRLISRWKRDRRSPRDATVAISPDMDLIDPNEILLEEAAVFRRAKRWVVSYVPKRPCYSGR